MAFDQPLDADRVDGDGFISSFVRAPIVGPVMWVLGGLLARDMAGDENKILEEDMFAEQDGNDNDDETMHPHGEGEEACEELDRGASASHCSGEMRPLEMPPHSQPNPSIRISEPQQEQTLLHSATNNSSGESQCASSASSEEEHDETSWRESAPGQEALFRRKSRRKMSWADESGQSLDDYYQESKSSPSESAAPTSACGKKQKSGRPIKSAIRNSRVANVHLQVTGSGSGVTGSGNAPMTASSSRYRPSQCVPSMPSSVGHGNNYNNSSVNGSGSGNPSQPSNSTSNSVGIGPSGSVKNGYISPQWGFYCNLTPPTPEYFQKSHSQSLAQSHSQSNPVNPLLLNTKHAHPQHHSQSQSHPQHHHALSTKGAFIPSRQPWTTTTTASSSLSVSASASATVSNGIHAIPKFNKGQPNYSSGWPTVPL